MDAITAKKVTELTSRFYSAVADSFSETRASAWKGWQRVLDAASAEVAQPFRILDAACGNMRFEKFLAESGVRVDSVLALDDCPQLAECAPDGESLQADASCQADTGCQSDAGCDRFPFSVRFVETDLLDGQWDVPCGTSMQLPNFTVCFGFMHHVPMLEQRQEFLDALVRATQPGGLVAVSFWQFAKSERLLRKAKEATERGTALHGICFQDENDYLLGWQSEQNAFRYCHNYPESEIDSLIESLSGAQQIERFSADGAQGDLNRYVLLKVKETA